MSASVKQRRFSTISESAIIPKLSIERSSSRPTGIESPSIGDSIPKLNNHLLGYSLSSQLAQKCQQRFASRRGSSALIQNYQRHGSESSKQLRLCDSLPIYRRESNMSMSYLSANASGALSPQSEVSCDMLFGLAAPQLYLYDVDANSTYTVASNELSKAVRTSDLKKPNHNMSKKQRKKKQEEDDRRQVDQLFTEGKTNVLVVY